MQNIEKIIHNHKKSITNRLNAIAFCVVRDGLFPESDPMKRVNEIRQKMFIKIEDVNGE